MADRRLSELKSKLDAQFAEEHRSPNVLGTCSIAIPSAGEAKDRFLKTHGEIGADGKYRGDSEHATWKKYRCALRLLTSFCEKPGIATLEAVTTDALEDYRETRSLGRIAWKVERQMLITFFGFCVTRKWISTNPAKDLKAARNIKPNEVVPYTIQEESLILAACDQIGGGKYNRSGARYEQLRARAMIMLLRHTALRVSDVCTLRKDAVSWDQEGRRWRVLLYTQKTGDPVYSLKR